MQGHNIYYFLVFFIRFPKNPDMCKKWIKALRRKDFKPGCGSCVCSDHFVEEAYDESKTSGFCPRRFLKPDAVPSVFAFPESLASKKVKTHKPPMNQKCPQLTTDVNTTEATDRVDMNSGPSCSLKSATAPTVLYVVRCVAKPTSVGYICLDHSVTKAFDESKTSGFCSRQHLRPDAVPSVSPFLDHLAPKTVNTQKPPLNQTSPQSTADHSDANVSSPTSSSLKSIKPPTIRYVGDCVAKDTDSLTDVKRKLDFVLSAYQSQQKRIKGLMQQCRRTNKRYIRVKNTLDELRHKSEGKKDNFIWIATKGSSRQYITNDQGQ